MTPPKTTKWPLEEHTKAKHEILRRYLQAWFPILSTYHGRIIFLDGFCGPGRYSGGELGSPLIALEAAKNHRMKIDGEIGFYFVDEDEDRISHLKSELAEISLPKNFKTTVKCNQFHLELNAVLDSLDAEKAKLAPTFAFVDPFGFGGIPFSLIKRLLRFDRCEVLINLNVARMNRFIEHPDEDIVSQIIDALGSEEARKIQNFESGRIEALRDLYQKQLLTVAKHVRFFEMRNKENKVVYYLFFASNNALGHLKFKEAMWSVDGTGDFVFSDATAKQTVLFDDVPESHVPTVKKLLLEQFGKRTGLDCKDVKSFIENETAFLKKHLTPTLRELESSSAIFAREMKADGKKRKKSSFPDGTIIDFKEQK